MENFKQPDKSYWPRPLLFISGKPDREGIKNLIRGCAECGYGGVGPVPYKDTGMDYLGEEYFKMYGWLLEEIKANKLKLCCYDEWWFPSGSAGGLFKAIYPEHCASRLDRETQELHMGENILPEQSGILMAAVALEKNSLERVALTERCQEERLLWNRQGEWELQRFFCRLDESARVNYLQPESVERFIALTHDQYFSHFEEYFGEVIDSAFYDEPQFYTQKGRSWTKDFNRKWKERYGFEADIWYPALWQSIGEETAAIRHMLLSFRADLYAEGFAGTIQKWCSRHSIALTGHIDQEEVVNPSGITDDLLKAFRYQDIPGIDQIFFPGRAAKSYKLVSSAAYNWDKQLVMCECFGAIPKLTEAQMYRETLDLYAKGINLFVPHAVWYDENNVFFPPELSWRTEEYGKFLKPFNLFCARLSMLLQKGGHVAEVAVLYPIEGLHSQYSFSWYEGAEKPDYTAGGPFVPENDYQEIGEALFYGCNCDFTFLHPERLNDSENIRIAEGKLRLLNTRHKEEYSVILLTGQDAIQLETLEKLMEFAESGGTVIATSILPHYGAVLGQNKQVREKVEQLFGPLESRDVMTERHFSGGGRVLTLPYGDRAALKQILDGQELDIRFCQHHQGLGYIHRTCEEREIYFLVNQGEKEIETDFTLRACAYRNAECWNPHTGEQSDWLLLPEGGRLKGSLRLPAQSGVFLLLNK